MLTVLTLSLYQLHLIFKLGDKLEIIPCRWLIYYLVLYLINQHVNEREVAI